MQYLNLPSIFGPRMVHKGQEQGINGLSVLYNQEHKLDDYLIIIINRMLSKLKKDPRTRPLVPTMNQVFSKQVLCEIHNPWEYFTDRYMRYFDSNVNLGNSVFCLDHYAIGAITDKIKNSICRRQLLKKVHIL
jgi:hypothetical protein